MDTRNLKQFFESKKKSTLEHLNNELNSRLTNSWNLDSNVKADLLCMLEIEVKNTLKKHFQQQDELSFETTGVKSEELYNMFILLHNTGHQQMFLEFIDKHNIDTETCYFFCGQQAGITEFPDLPGDRVDVIDFREKSDEQKSIQNSEQSSNAQLTDYSVKWTGDNITHFVRLIYGMYKAGYLNNGKGEITHIVPEFAGFLGIELGKNWQDNISKSIHRRNWDYDPPVFGKVRDAYISYCEELRKKAK